MRRLTSPAGFILGSSFQAIRSIQAIRSKAFHVFCAGLLGVPGSLFLLFKRERPLRVGPGEYGHSLVHMCSLIVSKKTILSINYAVHINIVGIYAPA